MCKYIYLTICIHNSDLASDRLQRSLTVGQCLQTCPGFVFYHRPTEGVDVRMFCVGSGLCDELIIRTEESYLMCVCVGECVYVSMCVRVCIEYVCECVCM